MTKKKKKATKITMIDGMPVKSIIRLLENLSNKKTTVKEVIEFLKEQYD